PRAIAPPAPPPVEEPPDRGRALRVGGVAAVAAGVALAGASIYFAVRSRSTADELEARFASGGTWDDEARALEDDHHAQRTWATALGVAGGVAVIAGGALLVWGGAF
ncbi:MAG TPA: hypothetical protein VMZ28_07320, partial [Kofleriaceae bacterium]|nr:hypothetical protein [Kofleriaceae bacterium]